MRKLVVFLPALVWATGLHAQRPEITLGIGTVEGIGWRAVNVELTYASRSDLRLKVATIEWTGRPAVQDLRVHCSIRQAGIRLLCDHGSFSARIPQWGPVEGLLKANFESRKRWRAEIEAPQTGLAAVLNQAAARLEVSARMRAQAAEDLRRLAAAFGWTVHGEFAGDADLALNAGISPVASMATVEVNTRALTYKEPSGRYAAENLSARGVARWDSGSQRWTLEVDGRGGQVYAEPLFLDFTALPSRAELTAIGMKDHWRIERLHVKQGAAGTLDATGLMARKGFKLENAEMTFDAPGLVPLFAADVQPFLIGTPLDGLITEGAARGTLSLRAGSLTAVAAEVSEVAFSAGRLGLSVHGLSGQLHWAAANSAQSSLRWSEGAMARVPFGPSAISFRAQGRDLELLAPWRQPLLGGALRVERLALSGLGRPQLEADFRGALEPIELAALCRVLDWPEFGGTLGGQLPGLRVRNDVWSIEGALEAQLFDGAIRLENLRAMEPFGVLPRVMADVHLRRLDLETLTDTFSFGRITGRLDGDVEGLRLLGWQPVAFDGRLFSTPGDGTRRRISQRAIDSISSIGGGPRGLLSRGFLSVFEDFSYDRIGIRCVLRDGRCQMDGIEPARSKDGRTGYYLVKGRALPRIDVVGYARSVSWDTLVEQVKAALASGGPQTQ